MKTARTPLVRLLQQSYQKAFRETNPLPPASGEPVEGGLSRKHFLRNIALGAPALMLPDFLQAGTTITRPGGDPVKVAIVGAGIAGLNACNVLSRTPGLDITIYEGSNRAGGRIFTARNKLGKNITTELGAEFIDTNHKEMFRLVGQYKLDIIDCGKDITDNDLEHHTYFFGGAHREEKAVVAEFKKMIPKLQKDRADGKDEVKGAKLDKQSLQAYLATYTGLSPWFKDLLYWAFTAEFGMEASDLNCLNFIDIVGLNTEEGFEIFGNSDERYKVKGGNETLIDALVKDFGSQIRYAHKLQKVTKAGAETVLHFENGTTAQAHYVIIAIPLTLVRKVKFELAAKMPDGKQYMIDHYDYGTNSKFLLGFKDRIWRKQGKSGYVINETIQNGWDNSQLQNKNTGDAGYTVFLGGKAGKEMADTDALRNNLLDGLEKVIKGIKQTYNDNHGVFNWSEYPFVQGSYACIQKGQWFRIDTAAMMAPVEQIYFAGEHCSEAFQGFMEGGAETGRMAAEAILEVIAVAQPAQQAEMG
ncbi:flavin monoamine oxidase family protein [Paraflavitalea pollutisoli]|uniref:flavin monoamine oxidase family protein n=1 Tax=Paraflavitalea pollutisoli TaxID=3034143 RepID=UPI0023ED94DA|nr:NAD(P)/FAD-dependent oxidoreductase [Paraflavitalea sp. H1-2-19X]